jgi:hypothetical protein
MEVLEGLEQLCWFLEYADYFALLGKWNFKKVAAPKRLKDS